MKISSIPTFPARKKNIREEVKFKTIRKIYYDIVEDDPFIDSEYRSHPEEINISFKSWYRSRLIVR